MSKKNKRLANQILHLQTIITLRIITSTLPLTEVLVKGMVKQVIEKEQAKIHAGLDEKKLIDFALKIAFCERKKGKMKKLFSNKISKLYRGKDRDNKVAA